LREALARSNHDFVMAEPRRKAPRGGVVSFIGTLARLIYRAAAYPNRLAGGLVFAIAMAILVNALMLQHSRHPAPLFHKSITLSDQDKPQDKPAAQPPSLASESPAPASVAPAQPPLPARDQIAQLLKSDPPAPSAANSDIGHPRPAPHRHVQAGGDPITQILTSGPAPETAAEEQPKTVLAVQQALVKLGFVVRPDGHMGNVTRHAIEQYEREHGLPVEARLTPKLLHRLAVETGIEIE
jgi:hypothetical protein